MVWALHLYAILGGPDWSRCQYVSGPLWVITRDLLSEIMKCLAGYLWETEWRG